MIYRRQRQQKLFALFLIILAAVNVLFLFILNRPARADYANLQEAIKTARHEAVVNGDAFDSLEKMSDSLGRFDRDKNTLLMNHLIQRNEGYSEILTRLDSLVQKTGVKKTRATYALNETAQAGLFAVAINLPLEGSYSNVVNFIRELETSDTFFIITGIALQSQAPAAPTTQQPAGVRTVSDTTSGEVALSLTMETYFYQ